MWKGKKSTVKWPDILSQATLPVRHGTLRLNVKWRSGRDVWQKKLSTSHTVHWKGRDFLVVPQIFRNSLQSPSQSPPHTLQLFWTFSLRLNSIEDKALETITSKRSQTAKLMHFDKTTSCPTQFAGDGTELDDYQRFWKLVHNREASALRRL